LNCTVITVDIDCFKEYNDTYGHLRGDLCLKRIAEILTETAASSDGLACRIGGDEFAVLLRESNAENARKISAELENRVRKAGMEHTDSYGEDVLSVSCGIGTGEVTGWDSVTELLERSDRDLYRVKAVKKSRGIQDSKLQGKEY
jgi:two-component system, chemotaxis family, response regulator WspR